MLDYRTHTFLEVYQLRSFTRAAQALLITQPAVSQHIKQLEAHYGCALFLKTGRGIEPTPAAQMLYDRLLTMENDEKRMREEAAELACASRPKGPAPLIFGCTRTIADYVAPRVVASHLTRHPDAPVTLRAGNTRDLVKALDEGVIDFALVEGSFDRKRFASETLAREPYVAVAAVSPHAEGSAAPQRPISIRDLLDRRLILREAGSGTREILEKHLAARDLAIIDFAGSVELESIPTIKTCVKGGVGITFVYRAAVQHELEKRELVDITPRDFEIEHDFSLIWQRGSQYSERYRALCDSWRKVLAQPLEP